MKGIYVLAHQLSGVEVGQILADVGFRLPQHGEHGFIHVDDVEVVIGDHHIGRGAIQRLAYSQVLVIERLIVTDGSEAAAESLPEQRDHGIELLTELSQWAAECAQFKLGWQVTLRYPLLQGACGAYQLGQFCLQQGMRAAVAEEIAKE